ncbi:zinc finger (C3HC4 RING finger) protein [Echinococcus multilocularis]|uniref:Zinc finger (C3HC4 RING finger) protein n=1 Tax=Echinococcus multilocularis TaxID=6211 RepID=A0A0S4ML09_ECHMU|nr:zinc finger (C3HC4 RING finger) protein [Echinococcus multilocularis]
MIAAAQPQITLLACHVDEWEQNCPISFYFELARNPPRHAYAHVCSHATFEWRPRHMASVLLCNFFDLSHSRPHIVPIVRQTNFSLFAGKKTSEMALTHNIA